MKPIILTHKIKEFRGGRPWTGVEALTDSILLDGRHLTTTSQHVDLDHIVEKAIRTGLENKYKGSFFLLTQKAVLGHEVHWMVCGHRLRKEFVTVANHYVTDNPPCYDIPKELCQNKPTQITVNIFPTYTGRDNLLIDNERPWRKIADKITKKKMRTTFRHCFRGDKSIVPDDTTWEVYQRDNSTEAKLSHSQKLARELLIKQKYKFREIFKKYSYAFVAEPNDTQRISVRTCGTKAEFDWQARQLIKPLGDKILAMTTDEMKDICMEFYQQQLRMLERNLERHHEFKLETKSK